ncbi:hypothetical protein H1D41_03435 [Rhodobacteraceae bacterium MYP1-1]|uniref:IclR-ED domain-containing protein n=1 Tax=Halocynthiibacter styelae TaxID=2761955 RepID=A0A8J7LKH3_9RHOB|nr:hypothetical protein [Paenihalocynthiibacter styelae]
MTRQTSESRKTGYIFDSQENEEGIACFGAAIIDQNNISQSAISVTVPLFRLHTDKAQYAPHLLQCIRTISEQLRAPGL